MMLTNNENLIYKYSPISLNLLRLLIQGEIWLSSPKDLNDPFECNFTINFPQEIKGDEIKEFYEYQYGKEKSENKWKEYLQHPEIFKRDYSKFIYDKLNSEFGVSCFSRKWDSVKMWSYYANSHEGVCLVFDKNELLDSLHILYPNIYLRDVEYEDKLPSFTILTKEDEKFLELEKKVIYTKFKPWFDEEEIRIINLFLYQTDRRNVPFNKTCLKGIILGKRIKEEDIDLLAHFKSRDKELKHLKFWKFLNDPQNPSMEFTEHEIIILDTIKIESEII